MDLKESIAVVGKLVAYMKRKYPSALDYCTFTVGKNRPYPLVKFEKGFGGLREAYFVFGGGGWVEHLRVDHWNLSKRVTENGLTVDVECSRPE